MSDCPGSKQHKVGTWCYTRCDVKSERAHELTQQNKQTVQLIVVFNYHLFFLLRKSLTEVDLTILACLYSIKYWNSPKTPESHH